MQDSWPLHPVFRNLVAGYELGRKENQMSTETSTRNQKTSKNYSIGSKRAGKPAYADNKPSICHFFIATALIY
jgi:hypothetical protein